MNNDTFLFTPCINGTFRLTCQSNVVVFVSMQSALSIQACDWLTGTWPITSLEADAVCKKNKFKYSTIKQRKTIHFVMILSHSFVMDNDVTDYEGR